MRIHGIILITALLVQLAPGASAATFSENQGGLLGNSSVISADGTGDYTSLTIALSNVSLYSGPTGPEYTFYIASDLDEIGPVSFSRNFTGGTKLVFRPLGQPRTVTVSVNTSFPFYSYQRAAIEWNLQATSNRSSVLFDGTLEGQADPGLTFIFKDINPPTTLSPTIYNGFSFRNDSSGWTRLEMRKLRVINRLNSRDSQAVRFESSFALPLSITDCEIESTGRGGGGILIARALGGSPFSPTEDTTTISRNVIKASAAGLGFYNRRGYIQDNRILIEPVQDEPSAYGIAASTGSFNPFTSNTLITGNYVVVRGAENTEVVQGIRYYGKTVLPETVRIENNMVSLNLDQAPNTRHARGITTVHNRAAFMQIAYNSVNLYAPAQLPELPGKMVHGIGAEGSSTQTLVLANNISRVESAQAAAFYYHDLQALQANGNVLGTADSSDAVITGDLNAVSYPTLAQWQAGSQQDVNSQQFDPLPLWVSPEDLHLGPVTAGLQPGRSDALIIPVTTDLDGDPRHPSTPTPGADEADLDAQISLWNLY